ncbi:hypothetical protein ARAM_002424 [Aspergillus rambellii]|uniref:Transferase family protein n=1 Tax=Aspergillus rambellii TaxID=308745 RepID=A0A0F8WRN0_9EURO|nr:hypothetical protein ARAM_002424 [Aspergillus rambellii]
MTQVHIPLTPFDHCVPRAYYNGAFYLALKSGVTAAEAFAVLHEGLHRTFVRLPWLSGKVYLQASDTPGWRPGQAEIRHSPVEINGTWPHQLKCKELDSSTSYEELKDAGFPTDAFKDDDLVWSPFFAEVNSEPEVFVAQANFIPGCCIITAAIHHAASDETAFIHVLRLWSENCSALQRGSNQLADMPAGSSDRNLPDQLWKKEGTGKGVEDIDLKTWMLINLAPTDVQQDPMKIPSGSVQPQGGPAQPQRVLKAGVFYISPANFTALQKAITTELGASSGVSGNDAICALIWRCFLRARSTVRMAASSNADVDAELAGLNMVCDGRPSFSSSIPPTYLGNITFNVQSRFPLSSLTSTDTSIAKVAATIRTAAGSIDSAHLLDLYTLLRNLSDFDHLARWKRMRTSSIEGNNMSISSMIMFPISSVCFGEGIFKNKGMPEAVRPLMEGCNRYTRICFILPKNKNGGIEFVANLFDEEMEVLMEDEEFGKYAACLCWS